MENLFKKIIIFFLITIMFSANGKFIIKEGFDNAENEIKTINKNSQLFYDAEGALRASIMISEYGDFTVSTNYGSVKQKLSFNSDGTLRTTGSRICLDDICLNKDDILKLKQVQLTGEPNKSVAASQAASQASINNAVKKEAIDKAIQDKTKIEIEISELESNKIDIDQSVEAARTLQNQARDELDRVNLDLESVNKEVENERSKLNIANINLTEAKNNGSPQEEINSLTLIAENQDNKLNSILDTQKIARDAVEKAKVSKGTSDRELELRLKNLSDNEKKLNKSKSDQIKAVQTLDLLTE